MDLKSILLVVLGAALWIVGMALANLWQEWSESKAARAWKREQKAHPPETRGEALKRHQALFRERYLCGVRGPAVDGDRLVCQLERGHLEEMHGARDPATGKAVYWYRRRA